MRTKLETVSLLRKFHPRENRFCQIFGKKKLLEQKSCITKCSRNNCFVIPMKDKCKEIQFFHVHVSGRVKGKPVVYKGQSVFRMKSVSCSALVGVRS